MKKIIDDLKTRLRVNFDEHSIKVLKDAIDVVEENLKDCVITHKDQIDALPNNEKLGEYVRSLRNNLQPFQITNPLAK